MDTCVIVIPARMGASRFPGKPLVDLLGKPMVQWVVEAARASGIADRVIVAAPDQEILDACAKFGGEAVLTSHSHPTGTDRIAEVAQKVPAEIYVNVQGDEPLIDPATIRACVNPMLHDPSVEMASVFATCQDHEIDNPACVKVVTDLDSNALYFSRYPIPFPRNERREPVKKHIGLYAFRRDLLSRFATWEPTDLEGVESLEQLRFLAHGVRIRMSLGEGTQTAIDTPEQVEEVCRILRSRMHASEGH